MDVSEGLWSADPNSNTGDSGYGGSLDDEGTFATRGPIVRDSSQGEHPTHTTYTMNPPTFTQTSTSNTVTRIFAFFASCVDFPAPLARPLAPGVFGAARPGPCDMWRISGLGAVGVPGGRHVKCVVPKTLSVTPPPTTRHHQTHIRGFHSADHDMVMPSPPSCELSRSTLVASLPLAVKRLNIYGTCLSVLVGTEPCT